MSFEAKLRDLLNEHCIENESNTPDYVLASYLRACLDAYANAVQGRDAFHGNRAFPATEGTTEGVDNCPDQ